MPRYYEYAVMLFSAAGADLVIHYELPTPIPSQPTLFLRNNSVQNFTNAQNSSPRKKMDSAFIRHQIGIKNSSAKGADCKSA